jgi:hypothetical protein
MLDAADENGVMSHVTRDGGQKNEDGQRDKGLGGGGLNQSRGVLSLARERERWAWQAGWYCRLVQKRRAAKLLE